jgi:hypothetical protein
LIVSFELGILKPKRRSSVISPNGFLLSFGFPNYKKEESVLFFKNLKKRKNRKQKKQEKPLNHVNSLQSPFLAFVSSAHRAAKRSPQGARSCNKRPVIRPCVRHGS